MAIHNTFGFICTLQFWRMAVLWTISLILSYFKLLFLSPNSKTFPRILLKDRNFTSSGVTKPVCVISGATSGLGAAAAYVLSKEGFYVVLVGRSSELLSKAVSDTKSRNSDACLKAFVVDLSSFKSILKFKSSLEQWLTDSNMHSSVQLLINNAGILATSSRVTPEGYDQMMSSNYIGPFCLTKVLLPLLENSPILSRVVMFHHLHTGTFNASRWTEKLLQRICILLFSYELHQQVSVTDKSHRLSVLAVDPGFVKTNIMREIPSFVSKFSFTVMKLLGVFQSPEIAIGSVLDAALAPPEVSGVYFFGGNGRTLNSSALSYDSKLAKDLRNTSCDIFQELQHSS